ncbi:hypothetical protein AAGS61_04205 [Lysinibacillus sp. KU-BSD001]|uniref:hypothetical protein n=1 Tax=Lysinibacillus sp. KU-BSD001 TaxID=3141328 RepID=UPI0036EA9B1A
MMNIKQAIDVYQTQIPQLNQLKTERFALKKDIHALNIEKAVLHEQVAKYATNSRYSEAEEIESKISEMTQSIKVLESRLNDNEAEYKALETIVHEALQTFTKDAEDTRKAYYQQKQSALKLHAQLFTIVEDLNEKRLKMLNRGNIVSRIAESIRSQVEVPSPEPLHVLLDELSLNPKKVW